MGIYLSAPKTEKASEDGENGMLRFGLSSMQGWRASMEDAHAAHPYLDESTSYFGVYDGHGGKAVSKFCAKFLHQQVLRHEAYLAGDIATSLQKSFLRMDEMMRGQRGWRELAVLGDKMEKLSGMLEGFIWSPRSSEANDRVDEWAIEEGPHSDFSAPNSGSTACVAVIRGKKLFVANAGDSRCVLSRKGQVLPCPLSVSRSLILAGMQYRPIYCRHRAAAPCCGTIVPERSSVGVPICGGAAQNDKYLFFPASSACSMQQQQLVGLYSLAHNLSKDHKPDLELEKDRILKAGGFIQVGRVNGSLNLARAIGDMEFKQNKYLPAEKQVVTADPDVTSVELCDDDEFLVIACDGIWDCMSSQQLVDYIHGQLKTEDKLSAVCEKVFDRCLAPTAGGEGCDNMTMILIQLKNPSTSDASAIDQPQPSAQPTTSHPASDASAHPSEADRS
ncbi:hypothetical protein KIW84_076927 [Lathyrus oleraceus]|uniref:protein-serine/threonine phosphatase n=1 Tax=Pisum sativum TaxID=3888 RepID=A0A9D4VY52_PEA|nr:hypothetical protein KIW84_076927 [Pisum sativum]